MEEVKTTRDQLFRSMLIDEEELLRDVLAKARKIFLLDSRGNLIFKVAKKKFNNKQLIGLYLLGAYVASELDELPVRSPALTADVLATLSGLDTKVIRARLSDLKKQLIVESPERGLYQITIPGAGMLLDEVLEDYNGDKER